MLLRRVALVVVALWAVLGVRAAPEPANLSTHKQELRAYVESGAYLRAVAQVAGEAKTWLETRARTGGDATTRRPPVGKPAIVMDLDETLFCNVPTILAHDFGYDPPAWEAWVARAAAPALAPMRDLYLTARRFGVAVIFLTDRPERQRRATEKNLRAIDCGDYAALICAPDGSTEASGPFKLGERRRLAKEGYDIVANVGDQESDFLGGGAGRTFKVPNPFYRTE